MALPLRGLLLEDVAREGVPAPDLALGGQLEALLRARVGLHLRHRGRRSIGDRPRPPRYGAVAGGNPRRSRRSAPAATGGGRFDVDGLFARCARGRRTERLGGGLGCGRVGGVVGRRVARGRLRGGVGSGRVARGRLRRSRGGARGGGLRRSGVADGGLERRRAAARGPPRAAPAALRRRVRAVPRDGAVVVAVHGRHLAGRLLLVDRPAEDRLRRAEHHRHVAPVEVGALLDDRQVLELLREALEQLLAALGVRDLAPAEHDRDLDLVLALQEARDMALLRVVVVLRDLRAELDLADRDLLLVLARGLLLLGLLVLVLRVVEDARDGRPRLGSDLHEIEVALLRVPQRFVGAHDTDLLAVLADDPDLGNADALVDPRLVPLGRAPVEPTGNRH